MSRFSRQEMLFGPEGQQKLRETCVAVVGLGGLGSHVLQQLAYLGIGRMILIDPDTLDETNKNRLIGAWAADPVRNENGDGGLEKTAIAERLVRLIDPSIHCSTLRADLREDQARQAITAVDWVFGCLDNDGARLLLMRDCADAGVPLIDTASDVLNNDGQINYGGRVCLSMGQGCLHCRDILSQEAIRQSLNDGAAERDRADIYGIDRTALDGTGPAVVYVNGVVASLAVAEFAAAVTGLRAPWGCLEYRGDRGVVINQRDVPEPDCYFCSTFRRAVA